MLAPKKTKGKTLSVARIKRKQKRRPRRPLEAVEQDWARWDAAAAALGLNFSEYARRALTHYAEGAERAAANDAEQRRLRRKSR